MNSSTDHKRSLTKAILQYFISIVQINVYCLMLKCNCIVLSCWGFPVSITWYYKLEYLHISCMS